MSVRDTLDQRGQHYGRFADVAEISQSIKDIYFSGGSYSKMDSDQREALDMIANKLARLLNGNPHHYDSWHDIAGYAELVAQRLKGSGP
jgi:hypothetical protein